jgi:hypothetical protein
MVERFDVVSGDTVVVLESSSLRPRVVCLRGWMRLQEV